MFESYHLSEKPVIVSKKIPGKNSLKLLKKQKKLESQNVSYPKGIPLAFSKAKGANIQDEDGNIYIDFFSMCGVVNLGHNNSFIIKKIDLSKDYILHSVDFPTKNRIEFIEKLYSNLPKKIREEYTINLGGPTGSDAIESAIKLAKFNTGRHSIIAFHGSYHGMTHGALSVTSKIFYKRKMLPLMSGVQFMPYSSCYRCFLNDKFPKCKFRCLKYFKNILDNHSSGVDKPAAILIEPIQGEGGIYIPQKGWLERIVKIAKDKGILVIFDEIQTGFYRTGSFFAFQQTKAVPDIITMSKGIGGIGFPLSLIIFKKELDTWNAGTHIGTFRGNQLGMTAGLAAMDFAYQNNISKHVKYLHKIFIRELRLIMSKTKYIGDVRGIGLMFGVEYVKDKKSKIPFPGMAKKVRKKCYERGLLVEIGGYYDNVIRILPPLIITKKMSINGLKIFRDVNNMINK